jgi:type I restriction enzyme S subunit
VSELPKGWLSIELENFVYIAGRIGWRGLKRSEYTDSGAAFLAVKNILPNGNIAFNDIEHISQERYDESPEIQLKENDIILTKDGTIGKIGMVSYLPFPTTVNSSLLVVRPCNLILPRFLFYYLRGPQFQTIARERITGSAVPHLFQKDIKKLVAVVPPLNEQRRIVAKLEKLLAKVDSCKERLDKIPAILKRFRQSVLSAACSGRLTADWRENNPDVESAEDLLKRIQENREKQHYKLCIQAKQKGIRKPKPLSSLELNSVNESIEEFPEIPDIWTYSPLSILSADEPDSIVDGPFGTSINTKTDYIESGVSVVRINNIRPFEFINNNLKFVSKEKFSSLARHKIEPGDILLVKVGATIGDCCIYPPTLPTAMLSTTGSCRIKVDNQVVDNFYVCIVLNLLKPYLKSIASEVAQPFLNMKTIKKLPIPLPPLAEQQEIVNRVQTLFKTADRIEQRYQKARTYIDQLTQSILAKAFRGELVPQDPNDEPASVLLERIRAERENRENVAKTAKKPAANKKQRSKKAQPPLEPTPPVEPIQLELPLFE